MLLPDVYGDGGLDRDQLRRELYAANVARLNPAANDIERTMNTYAMMNGGSPVEAPVPSDLNERIKREIASRETTDMPMITPTPEREQVKARNDYEKRIRQFMTDREKLIKNAEERARILRQSQGFEGLDLSPLAALVDSETGSNLQRGYNAPMSQAERNMLADRLQQQAGVGYGALANNEVQMAQLASSEERARQNAELRQKLLNQKQSTANQKPLSGELLKRLEHTTLAKNKAQQLLSVVDRGDTLRRDLPLVGDSDFTRLIRDAAEQFGRMQSGGAINKQEEGRFLDSIFKYGDDREMVKTKIQEYLRDMEMREKLIKSGGRGDTKGYTPAPNGSFDPDSFLGM